jgi:SAM-dependent methyltransferase
MSGRGPSYYVIKGGVEGRERLRLISRVVGRGTHALLDRVGIAQGWRCLDVGCGGGDVARVIARRAGSHGQIVGIDMDTAKIDLARAEAAAEGLGNIEFISADFDGWEPPGAFDLVYARFVLSHVPEPSGTIGRFYQWLRPGGRVALEDIDDRGAFVFPESAAFQRYCALYREVVRRRGGDASIGPRLPHLLNQAGFEDLWVGLHQPIALEGDVKLVHAVTLENTADAILQASLATRSEVDELIRELHSLVADKTTLMALPRIVQVCASRPQAQS